MIERLGREKQRRQKEYTRGNVYWVRLNIEDGREKMREAKKPAYQFNRSIGLEIERPVVSSLFLAEMGEREEKMNER